MNEVYDKSKELHAVVTLLNKKLHFSGEVQGNAPISIDYTAPYGDDLGYTSLELLLLSFSSCVGSALLVLLRKMQKRPEHLRISSRGLRKTEHPMSFSAIELNIELAAEHTLIEDVEKALQIAEKGLCPVWDMIKGNVTVTFTIDVQPGKST